MAIKTKEERQAKRQKRKSDRKSKVYVDDVYSTDNCVDDECRAFTKSLPKLRNKPKKERVKKNKKTKENKFYSAETSATDAPTWKEEKYTPETGATHIVIGDGPDRQVDYVQDDTAGNIEKAKAIAPAGWGEAQTKHTDFPTAESHTTIQGSGMKSGYHSQQLYKKTKSGELKAKKGIKMEGAMPLGEGPGILPSSAAITRRGHETTYESTRGMDRKEIRGARKRAYELDPENTTRYVSQEKLNRKSKRIQTQINRKATNKKGVKQELEAKPVQNYTHAADDTHAYNYATPTDKARKLAGSSTLINRRNKTKR